MSKGNGSTAGSKGASAPAGNSRLSSRKNRSKKGQTGWDDIESALLQQMIALVVETGALISFSKTTDGGALVLYVKDGFEEAKEYPASPDELEDVVRDFIETYKLG